MTSRHRRGRPRARPTPLRVFQGEGYVGIEGPFRVLSSAPWRGGWRRARRVVNVQVPFDFDHQVPQFFRTFEAEHGLQGSVGFLTAVDVATAQIRRTSSLVLVVTGGVGNPSRVGTINVLLALRGNPSPAAMVELVKVVTEAKVAAVSSLDIRAGSAPATGTSTDAVAIATLGRGREYTYAGPATKIGRQVGASVRGAVRDAIVAYHRWDEGRPISDRLRERGWKEKEIQSIPPALLRDRPRWEAAFGQDEALRSRRLRLAASDPYPFTRAVYGSRRRVRRSVAARA